MPQSLIRDAHRLSIDVLAWHPSGNLLASTSHDLILKFWCREPPGSKLEPASSEVNQENPPVYYQGPIPPGTYIAPVRNPSTTPAIQAANSTASNRFMNQRNPGGRDNYRDRRVNDNNRKRPREQMPDSRSTY